MQARFERAERRCERLNHRQTLYVPRSRPRQCHPPILRRGAPQKRGYPSLICGRFQDPLSARLGRSSPSDENTGQKIARRRARVRALRAQGSAKRSCRTAKRRGRDRCHGLPGQKPKPAFDNAAGPGNTRSLVHGARSEKVGAAA